jgi:membrane associated rhomboid family serine protease
MRVSDQRVLLRTTPGAAEIEDWALVLTSLGIHHVVVRTDQGFALHVLARDAEAAARALAEDDRENAARPAPAPTPAEYGTTGIGWVAAIALMAAFYVTGTWEHESRYFQVGAADAGRITAGQWWRALTALTLHADIAHVFGNAIALVIFVGALGRAVGPGVALAASVVAGGLGNLAVAYVHRTGHVSVGASTATFAGLGLLAGLGLHGRRRLGLRGLRGAATIAASLGLLAMLGMGKGTDILAHAFGLGVGVVLGIALGVWTSVRGGPPGRAAQVLGLALSLAALAAAWWRALA